MTGRAIINARGKPNRRLGGGGLLWDDHNIWSAFEHPEGRAREQKRREEEGTRNTRATSPGRGSVARSLAITRGKNIRFVGAYIRAREKRDYLGNARRGGGVDESVTLRENYVAGRESSARGSSARQLIVSLLRAAESRVDIAGRVSSRRGKTWRGRSRAKSSLVNV